MSRRGTTLLRALARGLRKRCPRCGRGALFSGWYTLHDRCAECKLEFEAEAGSTWAFMYVTTAGITGLIIVVMLLIDAAHSWIWRLIVLPIALITIAGTLPIRKSLAIALEHVVSLGIDPGEDSSQEETL